MCLEILHSVVIASSLAWDEGLKRQGQKLFVLWWWHLVARILCATLS